MTTSLATGRELPALTVGPFQAYSCGLVVGETATLEECGAYLEGLLLMERTIHWLIGDLIVAMDARYGEDFAQVVDAVGYTVKTLRNDAWVCRKIPPSRRREGVSFSVHAEVAGMEPGDQVQILDLAESEGLTQREVRAIRGMFRRNQDETANEVSVLILEIRSRLGALLELVEPQALREPLLTMAALLDDFGHAVTQGKGGDGCSVVGAR